MSGLQYAPGLAYVSGGGAPARHFAEGLVLWLIECGLVALAAAYLWKAHKRGLERVRRYNERHAPRHARKVGR
jgi:hypothetical protein